jgi:hypothetical protein
LKCVVCSCSLGISCSAQWLWVELFAS